MGDNCICKGETIFLIHVKLIVELIGGLNLVTSEYENYIRFLLIRIHSIFHLMHPNQYELSVRANLDISLIRVYGSRIFFLAIWITM